MIGFMLALGFMLYGIRHGSAHGGHALAGRKVFRSLISLNHIVPSVRLMLFNRNATAGRKSYTNEWRNGWFLPFRPWPLCTPLRAGTVPRMPANLSPNLGRGDVRHYVSAYERLRAAIR